MRVVVTGGNGFIGDQVVKQLRDQGDEPVILDRMHGKNVLNTDDVKRCVKGADGVIHLAGILGTQELFDNPIQAIRVNIEGSTNVMLACLEYGARFVNITTPHVWNNIYQATKQAVEKIASSYHQHYGLSVTHVRAFNVFGPGQKFGYPNKLVPTFSVKGWRDEPLPIWGDGEQSIDLIYVDDVARVLIDALSLTEVSLIEAGTGVKHSVNEVAELVLRVTGSMAGVEFLPMRLGEHKADVMSHLEGHDVLGWTPNFREADLIHTIESYRRV